MSKGFRARHEHRCGTRPRQHQLLCLRTRRRRSSKTWPTFTCLNFNCLTFTCLNFTNVWLLLGRLLLCRLLLVHYKSFNELLLVFFNLLSLWDIFFQEKDVPGSFGDAQRNSTPAGKKMYNFTCDIVDKVCHLSAIY